MTRLNLKIRLIINAISIINTKRAKTILWNTKNRDMNTVYIYFIHLAFNTTWSVVFFVFHNMVLALLVLIILIALIINLILRFKRVKMLSAYLMIPYLLWSSFALILNTTLIMLN